MASLSKEFEEEIKRNVSTKPLDAGEFRTIPCLESFLISLEPKMDDGSESLIKFRFDGRTIYIYRLSSQ